ncbi:MAG TPA: MgtC/SapB family protein [Thermoanaerobaculia bacterium]|jgi:putative Mg2+ transporter-C (MgtC) family protein
MNEPLLHWPAPAMLGVSAIRLALAAGLGALIGAERERVHSAAGLRTHMLVGLGSALFVLTMIESGADGAALSRVIQGLTTGIGFLGAGTILKIGDKAEVHGLTTAASIWVTAAVGVAAGLGHVWLAGVASLLGWLVLGPIKRLEKAPKAGPPTDGPR